MLCYIITYYSLMKRKKVVGVGVVVREVVVVVVVEVSSRRNLNTEHKNNIWRLFSIIKFLARTGHYEEHHYTLQTTKKSLAQRTILTEMPRLFPHRLPSLQNSTPVLLRARGPIHQPNTPRSACDPKLSPDARPNSVSLNSQNVNVKRTKATPHQRQFYQAENFIQSGNCHWE